MHLAKVMLAVGRAQKARGDDCSRWL